MVVRRQSKYIDNSRIRAGCAAVTGSAYSHVSCVNCTAGKRVPARSTIPYCVISRSTPMHAKRRSLEGAVAFAAFVPPPPAQRSVITALAAYQVIFDYPGHGVRAAERPDPDPATGASSTRRCSRRSIPERSAATTTPTTASAATAATSTRSSTPAGAPLAELPSYTAILAPVRRAAERIITYQSLNHGDSAHSARRLRALGQRRTPRPGTGLRWWETGAAAGSSLGVLALISATADPALTDRETDALDDAYYPWIGALHTLLGQPRRPHTRTPPPRGTAA